MAGGIDKDAPLAVAPRGLRFVPKRFQLQECLSPPLQLTRACMPEHRALQLHMSCQPVKRVLQTNKQRVC